MVDVWVGVAEEEGQRQPHDGGHAACELETVKGFPVWVGEEHEQG